MSSAEEGCVSAAEFAAGGTAEPGVRGGGAARAAAEFAGLAADYLDDLARRHPDTATSLGDHRFDDRLPDDSGQALAAERRALEAFTARLAAIEVGALSSGWTPGCWLTAWRGGFSR